MAAERKRRQFSESERQALVRDWRASGESAAAYSARTGLGKANLFRWSRTMPKEERSGQRQAVKSAFAAVRVVESARPVAPQASTLACEVDGVCGLRVRVYQGCDEAVLQVVLAAARGGQSC